MRPSDLPPPSSVVQSGAEAERARSLTLARALVLAVLAAVAATAVVLSVFLGRARMQIDDASARVRDGMAVRVEKRVRGELGRATRALDHLEHGLRSGAVPRDDALAVEACLFNALLDDRGLEEVTFTRATQLPGAAAFDADGYAVLTPEGRWQVSVQRSIDGRLVTTITRREAGAFQREERARPRDAAFDAAPFAAMGQGADPTEHATFSVLAKKGKQELTIWSDLHFAELDGALPQASRRVVVSVQRSVLDASGRFLGVARAALDPRDLEVIAREHADDMGPDDKSRTVILAASAGPPTRAFLLARARPEDPFFLADTPTHDVRFPSEHAAPEVRALLASPTIAKLDPVHPRGDGSVDVDGVPWAATVREITIGSPGSGTEGWFVAVLAPTSYYTHAFDALLMLFLIAFGVAAAMIVAIGAVAVVSVRRGLSRVVVATSRMRRFDFTPRLGPSSPFREVNDVVDGLERAKTVVRAMGKYIPLDLVRRLYESNKDPALGGDLKEVSLMFTDIEGFTTLAEKLPPDELARRLGDYLEAMTTAVEGTGGTIDKYIGDAVMAFWNAPLPVSEHAKAACRAVLACRSATRALYASAAWQGLPPLVTRFGLHSATVMIGHFGAPSRLSYTAVGDGVNLAARLEPLCKQYGVVVLVSEAIAAAARGAFVFRRVDRVAVKGKRRGIDVYELLGEHGEPLEAPAVIEAYERAFEAYLARDFAAATELLAPHTDRDGPSAVLHARCAELEETPPPDSWDGVHVATSK